jgi:hypothetical protein
MLRKRLFLACAAILLLPALASESKGWYAYHYHTGGGGGYHYAGGYHYGGYSGASRYGAYGGGRYGYGTGGQGTTGGVNPAYRYQSSNYAGTAGSGYMMGQAGKGAYSVHPYGVYGGGYRYGYSRGW